MAHRSAKTGLYVTKAKAKSSPATTVTESKGSPKPQQITIDTSGMSLDERAHLGVWMLAKTWIAAKGAKTYIYNPEKWRE